MHGMQEMHRLRQDATLTAQTQGLFLLMVCYSGDALPAVLEAVSRLVGKNYDPTIQQYWSCRIHSVVFPIWTPYPLVRHRVHACSDCPIVKLADSIAVSRVSHCASADSDCPIVELADSTL